MAEDESRATQTSLLQFDAPTFWRVGRWGLAAAAAVTLALVIGTSDMGMRRIALAFAQAQGVAPPAPPQTRDNGEVLRLSESVRRLTVDRDRLQARLDALERNLTDLTGSIALSFTPPRPATNSAPPEPTTAPTSMPANMPTTPMAPPTNNTTPSPSTTGSVPAQTNAAPPAGSIVSAPQSQSAPPTQDVAPPETPATPPATNKVEFGVDLGGANSIDGLRTLWNNAQKRHATALDGLRPIIVIREPARSGSIEFRLVVGPIPTAAVAARLCVTITTTGALCQPAVFDGQRLAMR